jgi:hypothetical protein
MTRVFDIERRVVEYKAEQVGYSMADFIRASLDLVPEHPPAGKAFDRWGLSASGVLLYGGKRWRGDIADLLNRRCVVRHL